MLASNSAREDRATATFTEVTASRKTTRTRGYHSAYRLQQKTVALLNDVIAVLQEYRDHWPLTVRQVFYRLIGAHGYEKTEAFYGQLCHHMAEARRGRVIPFDAIRDDGVSVVETTHFADQDAYFRYVRELGQSYRRDRLANQRRYIEVWCEAAGMVYQLASVAEDYPVPVYSSSGFDSLTAKKHLADRICQIGKPAVILHLGDFDPSGEAIFEAVAEDVAAFVEEDRPWATVDVRFQRVALTREQVLAYNLPTALPKATDSRSRGWKGDTCQLGALAPDMIAGLLRDAITSLIDGRQYTLDLTAERWERQQIAYALPAPREGGAR